MSGAHPKGSGYTAVALLGGLRGTQRAKALKHRYGADERSQMLKYHIQTSGRSLHAQEIDFNDIRTTLQALYAIYDNCNSLHTNAYDEAITTPARRPGQAQAPRKACAAPWPQGTTPCPERMPRAMIVRPGKARGREATTR